MKGGMEEIGLRNGGNIFHRFDYSLYADVVGLV